MADNNQKPPENTDKSPGNDPHPTDTTAKPVMPWPNRISIMRILLIVPLVIAIVYMDDPGFQPWARYAAIAIFLVAAISDGIDGYLARKYHSITNLGRILDPLADKLLISCTVILLSFEHIALPDAQLPYEVVIIILGKDLYMVLGFLVLKLFVEKVPVIPKPAGKLSTAIQLIMVLAILISPDIPWQKWQFVMRSLWWSAAVAAAVAMLTYTRNGAKIIAHYELQQKNQQSAQQHPQ